VDPDNLRGLRAAYNADNLALFGQIAHDFSAHTRLIFGLRTERVEIDGRGTETRYRKTRGTYDPVVTSAPAFRIRSSAARSCSSTISRPR